MTKYYPGRVVKKLTLISRAPTTPKGIFWLCRCECGTEKWIDSRNLWKQQSCGCVREAFYASRRQLAHGACVGGHISPEYLAWARMKYRCCNPDNKSFVNYGGRGITVCEEWRRSFQSFYSYVGERPTAMHSLGRIDNNGNYEPGNVRWELPREQARNKRSNRLITFAGETLSIIEWAERANLTYSTLYLRIKRGWTPEEALANLRKDGSNVKT